MYAKKIMFILIFRGIFGYIGFLNIQKSMINIEDNNHKQVFHPLIISKYNVSKYKY